MRGGTALIHWRTKRWASLFALVASFTLVASACGGGTATNTQTQKTTTTTTTTANQGPVDGGTFTFAELSDITTLNPAFINDVPSQDAQYFISAPIYDSDTKGNPIVSPRSLAAAPLQVENGGTTLIIKLKDNLKWSDGQPLTAEDIAWSANTIANPDIGSPLQSYFAQIKEAKALDPTTVQIDLKQVYAPFVSNVLTLGTWVLPKHVLGNVPAKELQKNPYGADPAKTLSFGPWVWKTWVQKQYLEFDVNPNYWGPKPHIQKIIYKIYADQNTAIQALLKGDIDMAPVPIASLSAVEAKKDMLNIINEPAPSWDYIGFNFKGSNFPNFGNQSPFAGEKTRQAIAYAIDRQAMLQQVLKGNGQLIDSPFLPTNWAYQPGAAVHYTYDPQKAQQLLAEDGWTKGPDGYLYKNGHRFEFTLQYNTGNIVRQQVANIVQQELKQVGIKVDLQALDFSTWIDQWINVGKGQAVLLGWYGGLDPDNEPIFSSKYYPPNGQNWGWYTDKAIDQLWVQGWSTTDVTQRKQIYAQIAQKISTDLPYVFLWQRNAINAYNKRVKWQPEDAPFESVPYAYFWHIQNWWIAPGS
ncbi:MAG: peptide ABC transporter substrate-binding protein [Clostridia bacterium]|nr:peptide ABC transporter substrate-binding protein [Clostridia bacterium]